MSSNTRKKLSAGRKYQWNQWEILPGIHDYSEKPTGKLFSSPSVCLGIFLPHTVVLLLPTEKVFYPLMIMRRGKGEDWRNVLTKANAGSKKWKEYNKIKTSDIVTKEKVGMCNKGMNKFRPLILLCSEIEILLELMKEKGRMRNVSGNFWM